MTSTPLVTVVVPVYNVEPYISACIKSIQNQTHENLEILIINDGATDDSIKRVQYLIDTDKRISVISQENAGLSAARNTGIDNAHGEYIALVDSDDVIKPNFIKDLLSEAIKNDADIVRGSFRDLDGDIPKGWVADMPATQSINGRTVLDKFLDNSTSFAVWSSLYKTEFLNDNKLRFTPGILLEDGDFTTRAYLKAKTIINISKADYEYRIRPGSILTANNNLQKMSDSEAYVIGNFVKMHDKALKPYEQHIIAKAIYAFMRDWTRILAKNDLDITSSRDTYKTALNRIKNVVKQRPIKERLKFQTKLALIKLKYR